MGNKQGKANQLNRQPSDLQVHRGRDSKLPAAHRPSRGDSSAASGHARVIEVTKRAIEEYSARTPRTQLQVHVAPGGQLFVPISRSGASTIIVVGFTSANGVLSFTAPLGDSETNAPAERVSEVAVFVTKANYGLHHGRWEVDVRDGEIRFIEAFGTKHLEGDDGMLADAVQLAMNVVCNTFWRYYWGVRDVASGRLDAREAIQLCEASGGTCYEGGGGDGGAAADGAGAGAGGGPAPDAPLQQASGSAFHEGIKCDGCGRDDFAGNRFKCLECFDYDLCQACFGVSRTSKGHNVSHRMAMMPVAVHGGVRCDGCNASPIVGTRWVCRSCPGSVDLCGGCQRGDHGPRAAEPKGHSSSHAMRRVRRPADESADFPTMCQSGASSGGSGAAAAGDRPPGGPVNKFVADAAVTRGPDWKWNDQDGGEGCVGHMTGMSQGMWVNVCWTGTGVSNAYRIGQSGKYDLAWAPPDASGTSPQPGRLATFFVRGAAVTRGRDWKWDDQDGGRGAVGRMVEKDGAGSTCWVRVAWPNGSDNIYRVGAEGKFDLEWAVNGAGGGGPAAAAAPAAEPAAAARPVGERARSFVKGAAVRRGPDWKWGDQDGRGVGRMRERRLDDVVQVAWANGRKNVYRIGSGGAYDLVWADESEAAAAGISVESAGGSGGSGGGGSDVGVATLLAKLLEMHAAANASSGGAETAVARAAVAGMDLEDLGGGIMCSELVVNTADRKMRLGKGGMGEVYLGEYCGAAVAVKALPAAGQSSRMIEMFVAEVKLQAALKHPNIVQVMGVCRQDDQLLLVQELCQNKSLGDVLGNQKFSGVLTTSMRIRMLVDTAQGMLFLHGRDVVHLDLKTLNLLVTESFHVKVGDFGLSQQLDTRMSAVDMRSGTPFYMAPELLRDGRGGKPADVYAFGIVMYEVVTRREPYGDMQLRGHAMPAFYRRVYEEHLRPTMPEDTPPRLRDLIVRCWAPDPRARPDFREVLRELKEFS